MSFEVELDTLQRIRGFRPSASEEVIEPHRIGERLDGGERVTVEGQEFNLTERGNLIACAVEMPDHLTIGYGVYIGSGVTFVNETRKGEVVIGSSSRIGSTESLKIGTDVEIGKGAIVAARSISRTTKDPATYAASNAALEETAEIGNLVYIGQEAEIGLGVHIGSLGRISTQAMVADGTYMEQNVSVGFRASVGNHCHLAFRTSIGEHATLGSGVYMDLRSRVSSGACVQQSLVPKDQALA